MSEQIPHFATGDPLNLPAGFLNLVADTVRDYVRKHGTGPTTDPGQVDIRKQFLVFNSTGSNLPQFGVVSIGNPVCLPSKDENEFRIHDVFIGHLPATSGTMAILQEPVPKEQIGEAIIFGYSKIKVDFASLAHEWADQIDDEYHSVLSQADPGPAKIVWKETAPTSQLAGGIDPDETELEIDADDADDWPDPDDGEYVITIGAEDLLVTARDEATFTVERGYNGTTAATHSGSAAVTFKSGVLWALVLLGAKSGAITSINGDETAAQLITSEDESVVIDNSTPGTTDLSVPGDVIEIRAANLIDGKFDAWRETRDNESELWEDDLEPVWVIDLANVTTLNVGNKYLAHRSGVEVGGPTHISIQDGVGNNVTDESFWVTLVGSLDLWYDDENYVSGRLAERLGSVYIAVYDNIDDPPEDESGSWLLLPTGVTDRGAWSNTAEYVIGDFVQVTRPLYVIRSTGVYSINGDTTPAFLLSADSPLNVDVSGGTANFTVDEATWSQSGVVGSGGDLQYMKVQPVFYAAVAIVTANVEPALTAAFCGVSLASGAIAGGTLAGHTGVCPGYQLWGGGPDLNGYAHLGIFSVESGRLNIAGDDWEWHGTATLMFINNDSAEPILIDPLPAYAIKNSVFSPFVGKWGTDAIGNVVSGGLITTLATAVDGGSF